MKNLSAVDLVGGWAYANGKVTRPAAISRFARGCQIDRSGFDVINHDVINHLRKACYRRNLHSMKALTLDEAQHSLPDAVQKALHGESVAIKVGSEIVRLVREVPIRPAGYFADCYRDAADAAFEERLARDSRPTLDE